MNTLKNTAIAIFTAGTVGVGAAHAALPPELETAVTTLQTDGSSAIAMVGAAMLTLAGIAILFKWAKAAFFG